MCVTKELAITRSCAHVVRNGFISDVVKWSLCKVSTSFVCKSCTAMDDEIEELGIGSGILLEKGGKSCYLGDMLNAHGGCDLALMAGVRCEWKSFESIYIL